MGRVAEHEVSRIVLVPVLVWVVTLDALFKTERTFVHNIFKCSVQIRSDSLDEAPGQDPCWAPECLLSPETSAYRVYSQ